MTVAPSAKPANVPDTASVPSLLMIVNDWMAEGTKPLINPAFNVPASVTVPVTLT